MEPQKNTVVLEVELSRETIDKLRRWERETGKPLSELFAAAIGLLGYALDKDTKLIKESDGQQVQLTA